MRFLLNRAWEDGMMRTLWVVGCLAVAGLTAQGCHLQSCTDMAAVGAPVRVALVDDAGAPVIARGEVRYSLDGEGFDCTTASTNGGTQAGCKHGVLELQPLNSRTDTIALRFRLDDDSFTDWIPVDLTVKSSTDPDFNGPGCGATTFSGTAKPVIVPEAARLPAG
ncbi:MAG TPA: hypothetical protein VHP33_23360 [Polyangiaceae bacterium]|nr:hypothetical protein [Polyangiaceae bacterium]